MAHVWWHSTVHEPGFLLFFANKSLHFSRIPTLHKQILMPVQNPDSVHANPYACTGSQKFKPLLLRGEAPKTPAIPSAGAGSQRFTCKSLCLYRFPTIQTIPCAGAGLQCFTPKSLHF
ncbi:hypothetical protein O181_097369 [Austropuccinia psidii MF-1]|uniref:Uncharacterized protein n=1 Tax=Austropuccinia psidii MF-1 TaxID=1389203 RepID=A0A9Q3J8T5_9BASI|nr:hypothetical protein [Austropuccinia psidii MF-1]